MTCIKTDDIISTLQKLQLIQYQRGQHVISAAPELIDQCLKAAGSEGKKVYPEKLIWTPYNAERSTLPTGVRRGGCDLRRHVAL
eukprot:jgi/Pico_ML_1/55240/g965.t1